LDLPSADLDLPKLDADLDLPSADFDLPKLDADLDLPSVDVAASADDLTVISGIGPKIASILHNNGIRSFAQLAASDTATLRQILDAAGSRYKLADPTTWPEQARFAGNVGEFDAAVAPADEVIVEYFEIEAAAPTEEKVVVWEIVEDTTPDDLVAIVGIGPKIAGILNRNGIYSFAQLANSRVGDLQQMLDAAGPRYSLADPASWPQQAYDLLTSRHMAAATARADFNDATGYAEADSVKMVEVIEVVAEEESVIEAVFEEDFGEDDLTVISGIGPKVADVLKLNGLVNYRQLMRTDVDTLRSVLQQAGPRFTLIDPASWPVQAELAARNDWEGLNALHAQMGIQWL
ncbi:MAG: helix-hairpin-helix domain-containing protein, partial [Caldilineales bacterium]